MSRRLFAVCSLLALHVALPSRAFSMPPPFVSDRELAQSPIVVVAKWTGAAWKDNSLVEGNVLKKHEVQTEIEVERVISGDIEKGRQKILVGFAIGWTKENPLVMSYMSTQVAGDATATESNLWFLNKIKSRADGQDYPYLSSYRAVQPLVLEPYFKALRTKNVETLPKLLSSSQQLVQIRTLEQIAGGDLPWPYQPWDFIRPKSTASPLREEANAVGALARSAASDKVRRIAAAVYARLRGKESVPLMRELLSDKDTEVRAIAVGTLAAHQDLESVDRMPQAVAGLKNPHVACELIARLRRWNHIKAVPVLIEFLEDDGLSYVTGNDLGIPAVKAQQALRKVTGHAFPFDVTASRNAWSQARDVGNREQRVKLLGRILANDPKPWKAVLLREDGKYLIEVTNRSKQSRSLLKRPSYVDVSYSHGVFSAGGTGRAADGKARFATLAPGSSLRFPIDFGNNDFDLLMASGTRPRVDLQYLENGNQLGLKAWLGVVSVSLEDARRIEDHEAGH